MILATVFFVFLFGLVIGSFLNVVILRLNAGESLNGRSHCPHCQALIHWYDNIPLLSFLILKGKCRNCKTAISLQYPLVELATGLLFIVAFLMNFEFIIYNLQTITNYKLQITNYSAFLTFIRDIYIISVLIVIFVIDLKWYVIFDIVTLPAAGIVLLANWLLGYDLWNLLISGIIGAGFFLVQYLVSRGKWIGGGDIRLGLLMGFALGWPGIAVAIFASYIIGSFVGIGLILSGKKAWGSRVPLGTFLVPGTILALFWGQSLIDWYFGLITLPY